MDANQPTDPTSRLPEPFYRGKVRNLYPVDSNSFVMVATDRISAFDVVFPEPIPGKGVVLTQISKLWFRAIRRSGLQTSLSFTDHVLSLDEGSLPPPYNLDAHLADRALYVRQVNRVDFECVVRGYLAGSAHKDYM
ncbi:MAG: hypothetical protein HY042_12240, partial [Spirochaetia bacterium]|nr:hypothetical protein [Spirochaetia bacterium]